MFKAFRERNTKSQQIFLSWGAVTALHLQCVHNLQFIHRDQQGSAFVSSHIILGPRFSAEQAEDAPHMLQHFMAAVQVLLYRKHSWIFHWWHWQNQDKDFQQSAECMHAAGCEQQLPAARLVRLPLSLNHVCRTRQRFGTNLWWVL